jgi:hypothetical protein
VNCGVPHPSLHTVCSVSDAIPHADHAARYEGDTVLWDNESFTGIVPVAGRRHALVPPLRDRTAMVQAVRRSGNAPTTSLAAAEAALPKSGTRRREVYDILLTDGDLTDNEIGERLSMDLNTVRPRRGELEEMGLVMDSGVRRLTPSGNEAIVWKTTP